MRALVALIAILVLAGCLGSAPQAQSPPTTNDTTPTDSPQPPTSPALGGGTLVRPAHGENATDGFRLTGDEAASGFMPGGSVEFVFAGTNDGAPAKVLSDPCGGGNPKVHIEDENGTQLALSPPAPRCMIAVGFVDSPSGARYETNLTWNGTVYDGERASEVPDGTYYAVGTFTVERASTPTDLVVKIPVHVFQTRGIG